MTRRSLVLHWMFLSSLMVLILNDHVFKSITPGTVTGKLSDVAGLVMFPILAASTLELILGRATSAKTVWGVALGTAILFASMQLLPLAAHSYQVTAGWIQWLLTGASGTPQLARHVADAWDNIALPCVLAAPYLHARRSRLAQLDLESVDRDEEKEGECEMGAWAARRLSATARAAPH